MVTKRFAIVATMRKEVRPPEVIHAGSDILLISWGSIRGAMEAEIHVRFEAAPDLISGIELSTNGQKVAWSIADYLASLEKGVDALLKEKNKAEAKAEPEPETESQ
jgi:hypothetical protein